MPFLAVLVDFFSIFSLALGNGEAFSVDFVGAVDGDECGFIGFVDNRKHLIILAHREGYHNHFPRFAPNMHR